MLNDRIKITYKKDLEILSVLDTTICAYNLGNQIIMDSIYKIINEIFPEAFVFKLQYAEKFGMKSLKYIYMSKFTFLGGTNALSSNMNRYSQIGLKLKDLFFIRNKLVLLGVGWWQYQPSPNLYTRFFLKNLLSKTILHSVRDSYTEKMLKNIGINNVINTSCPTTWTLTPNHCSEIPSKKSENVVITLTDYNKNRTADEMLLRIVVEAYKNVFLWVQGLGDLEYVRTFGNIADKIKIIPPRLDKYDELLKNEEIDYIGTRLHAGIRALQHKKRSLIIAIDNRAKEMSKDINLNIIERKNIRQLESLIFGKIETKLDIPIENINKWKAQFR